MKVDECDLYRNLLKGTIEIVRGIRQSECEDKGIEFNEDEFILELLLLGGAGLVRNSRES